MSMSKGLRVYHKLDPPYSLLIEARNNQKTLFLEPRVITELTPKQTDCIRRSYTKAADAYGCLGILRLPYGKNIPVSYLVLVTSCVSVGRIESTDIYRISAVNFLPLQLNTQDDNKINELKKFLSSGSFYFFLTLPNSDSYYDLSYCAQNWSHAEEDSLDRFFWNRTLHQPFKKFGVDTDEWLLKIMCGGVEIRTIYASQKQGKACLISRLSSERVGTRFNVRGVNDAGHVANFVETEQVIFLDDMVCSHVQVRGSVPLFWEQPGFQVGSHKVKLSRGNEASAPAFERHLRLMEKRYGNHVIVNLLGSKESEQMLSSMFKKQHSLSKRYSQKVPYIAFDYHSECRGGNLKNLSKLKHLLTEYIDSFEFFFTHPSIDREKHQNGTFRINCLDCLDRTNSVQTMIGLEVLQRQLQVMGLADKPQMKSRFEEVYKSMWSMNGDHSSRIYAGTGALGGGRSKAQDAARSANRTLQNNFLDSTKQEAIDLLVKGGCLEGVELNDRILTLYPSLKYQLPMAVIQNMLELVPQYSSNSKIRVCVGTWNVNGGKHFRSIAFKHEQVTDWLLDLPCNNTHLLQSDVDYNTPTDIFAIGFQEIVDLNAGNIVNASTQNQKDWAVYLQKCLSRDCRYVILTSVQLVGVCLFMFVRPRLAKHIKNLAVTSVKTGLGGTTGNKGGVAIRFQVYNSSMCFVCSHYAAGQSNVKERNSDFHDISNRITFPMNRKVWNHDHIFYCGDFNYRIDMRKDEVKELVAMQDWVKLKSADQLTVQRLNGNVFQGFQEGEINFAPTYKYDLFCDDYDTSEKCRVPAWTDRILWTSRMFKESSSNLCRQIFYHRSELKTSDHRPVLAIFDANVLRTKAQEKQLILHQQLHNHGPSDCCVKVSCQSDEDIDNAALDKLLAEISLGAEVVLVRFISRTKMLVNFRHPSNALESTIKTASHHFNIDICNKEWLYAERTGEFNTKGILGEEMTVSDEDEDDKNEFDQDDDKISQKEANLLLSFDEEDAEVTSYTKNVTGLSSLPCQSNDQASTPTNHLSLQPVLRNAVTPTLAPDPTSKSLTTSSSVGTFKDVFDNNNDSMDEDNVVKKDNQMESKKDATKGGNVPSRPPPPKISEKNKFARVHIIKPFFPPKSSDEADSSEEDGEDFTEPSKTSKTLAASQPYDTTTSTSSKWYTQEAVPSDHSVASFQDTKSLLAVSVETKKEPEQPLLLLDHVQPASINPFSSQELSSTLRQYTATDLLVDLDFHGHNEIPKKVEPSLASRPTPPVPLIPSRPAPVLDKQLVMNQQLKSLPISNTAPPVIPARSSTLPSQRAPQGAPPIPQRVPPKQTPQTPLTHQSLPQPLIPSRPPSIPPRKN